MTHEKGSAAAPRISILVARAARRAVVLRRGPSKRVQMLSWDLATDVVTPGQWFPGRVYADKCDLSPDGRLMVYFAGTFTGRLKTFTALCRPPFFTALALWPDGETNGGGGTFVTDRYVELDYGYVPPELHGGQNIPPDFVVRARGQRDPADRLGDPRVPGGSARDGDGSLIFARDGQLFRRTTGSSRGADRDEVRQVADLRGAVYRAVLPPASARVWPGAG